MSEARAALVERMNKAYWQRGQMRHPTPEERMSAALDIALEEAARIAEGNGLRQYTGLPVIDEIAAAIRALKSG